MTTTIEPTTPGSEEDGPSAEAAAGALAERLFHAGLGALDVLTVYLGVKLGLYAALAARPESAPSELAHDAGIAPRYAREWLEQQTVAGIIACDDRQAEAEARRYSLPPGHDVVLLDADSPACMAPIALAMGGITGVLHQLLDAYRTGSGVPYSAYGSDFRDGQAGFNRPAFLSLLATDWLAAGLPDVHARLASGETMRIADVACGAGWSSIALARAYPNVRVDGIDTDDASIADARHNASANGVADRVTFEVRDAADIAGGEYDLVCVFEALHDMSRPVDVLRSLRAAQRDGGAVLIVDERAADTFAESDGPIEGFLYAASVLHCLPVGMAEQPSAATGTVMRTDTLRAYAQQAGFADVEVLPIEHDLFRFYRLV
jgi:2-polyprenyl-3-methyl-5-hydroxy-6-metoxy-1,4-benzoquinol methylase